LSRPIRVWLGGPDCIDGTCLVLPAFDAVRWGPAFRAPMLRGGVCGTGWRRVGGRPAASVAGWTGPVLVLAGGCTGVGG